MYRRNGSENMLDNSCIVVGFVKKLWEILHCQTQTHLCDDELQLTLSIKNTAFKNLNLYQSWGDMTLYHIFFGCCLFVYPDRPYKSLSTFL